MRIGRVACWVLNVPFTYPLLEETFKVQANFLEIETDDGLTGNAMSAYPMKYGIREFINREATPVITGMDPMRPEDIRSTLFWRLSNKYFMGTWSCSASLIDIALWDIKGKATGQPVWKLLGGAHTRVPAYITFGLPRYSQEELVEVARTLVRSGQDKLKMVVGAGPNPREGIFGQPTDEDIDIDAERVRALRDAVGDKVHLMIDANKNPTYTQAFRLAKLVEDCNLTWFEDPVQQADPRLMAYLRRKTTVPLAAGSTATSDLLYFREYLLQEAVDIIQPNVRDIGGYTGGIKAAALAKAFNIPMAMGGNWPHINMHLHAGVENGGWVEFHWQGWHVVESLFNGTPSPINGWVTLPEAPGLGFTPKAGIVKDLAVE